MRLVRTLLPPPGGRGWLAPLFVLLLALGVAPAGAEDEEAAESPAEEPARPDKPPPIHKLYVPFRDLSKIFEKEGEGVFLQSQSNSDDPAARAARQVVPNGGGCGEEHRSGNHRVWPSDHVQEGHKQQAAGCRSNQIEKIQAIDTRDGVGDSQGNRDPRKEEWQRTKKIDQRQRPVAGLTVSGEHENQSQQHSQAISGSKPAEFAIEVAAPADGNIRENASRSEPEKRDGDCQKGEMVVEDDRKKPC